MKEHFLLDEDIIFLNHGSFGACPKVVFENYQLIGYHDRRIYCVIIQLIYYKVRYYVFYKS